MTTEIVFVLDRSGSMGGLEDDVIRGFNSFLVEQQKLKDKASLTTILFDDKYEVLYDGIDLQEVRTITKKEYFVRGSTALLDAIGKSINTVKSHTSKKDSVLFLVNTDGYENASKEYTNEKIKELVSKCEKNKKWKFVFLGANIDSFAVGNNLGITTSRNYTSNGVGTKSVYDAVSTIFTSYRCDVANSKDGTADLNTSALKEIQ
jgi:uncharacterized protein with von Willebrand factor type A (vWA) domain